MAGGIERKKNKMTGIQVFETIYGRTRPDYLQADMLPGIVHLSINPKKNYI